jgi:hypothetical protein
MRSLTVLLVTLMLHMVSVAAYAAPKHPMSEARALELLKHQRFSSARINLQDMADALNKTDTDRSALLDILGVIDDAQETVDALLELAIIYQRMINPDDRAEVAHWIPDQLEHTEGILKASVRGINGYMTVLTSPAIVAETRRVRDQMQKLEQEFRQYEY